MHYIKKICIIFFFKFFVHVDLSLVKQVFLFSYYVEKKKAIRSEVVVIFVNYFEEYFNESKDY